VAGGSKFICRGILFKFYRDVQLSSASSSDSAPLWLYGGIHRCDEKAMKSARNELKGLSFHRELLNEFSYGLGLLMYYQCDMEGVNFPLMVFSVLCY
jgi:hypothetical protein